MIPSPWVAVILTLAVFRCAREIGYGDFPSVLRLRRWATGYEVGRRGSSNSLSGMTSETPELVETYKRPTLHALLACPYCIGFWTALVVYLAWVFEPRYTLYGAAPFALSAASAWCARWLDP